MEPRSYFSDDEGFMSLDYNCYYLCCYVLKCIALQCATPHLLHVLQCVSNYVVEHIFQGLK